MQTIATEVPSKTNFYYHHYHYCYYYVFEFLVVVDAAAAAVVAAAVAAVVVALADACLVEQRVESCIPTHARGMLCSRK